MEEAYPKPILTLAIPTYNRPDKLKDLLDSILSQYQHQLSIELVISDNSPGVETENLVAEYKKILPITYIHQPTNIGAAGNYLFTVEAAQGSYCWILGDDDLIIDGSIAKLLSIIEAHPTLPAIVCGYSNISENERQLFRNKSYDAETIQRASVFEDTTICGIIDRWENTFFLSKVPGLHFSILSCVFKRNLWLQNSSIVAKALASNQKNNADDFEALYSTFPHTTIWGKMLIGQPIFVISKPMACLFYGEQEWISKLPVVTYTHGLSLGNFYRSHGANARAISHFKNIILGHNLLYSLLTSRNPYDMKKFSILNLVCENLGSRALWKNLFSYFNSNQIPWKSKLLTFSSILSPVHLIRLALAPWKPVRSRVQPDTPLPPL